MNYRVEARETRRGSKRWVVLAQDGSRQGIYRTKRDAWHLAAVLNAHAEKEEQA